MRKHLHLIIYIGLLFFSAAVHAQSNSELRRIFSQAESDYQIGRLDQALELLQEHTSEFSGNLLQNAYRLISLCYLAMDETEKSEKYASLLLEVNPYYNSTQDPIRFEEIIDRLKQGRSVTVTTASSQAESINEAPVPVTIITREMIDNLSNNKDLSQILCAYVPGLSQINSYAMSNVAMHGIYTSHQEKILVMENGHRLNARSTNAGRMDYAISTEKIDHIEVLRGPASSLYGNVALTAVVNIITKKGADINGAKIKYGYGSYNTHRGDLTLGTSFLGADVMAWASLYTAQGKEEFFPHNTGYTNTQYDGNAFIGRYDRMPSFDMGCTFSVKDYSFMLSRRYGKRVPQYSWYGEVYDYEKYRYLNGITPGYSVDETHLNLSYSKHDGVFNRTVSLYGDWYKFNDYTVISDSTMQVVFNSKDGSVVMGDDGKPKTKQYRGMYQNVYWEEFTVGLLSQADAPYRLGTMHGNALIGLQVEHFMLYDTNSLLGEDFETVIFTLPQSMGMIHTGNESSISLFLQDKHYFTPSLILNAGLRYDRKIRKDHPNIDAFSPRVALVYTANKGLNAKFSYSRAFVDAPYFYRHNTSNAYRGSADLMPEYLNALQFEVLGDFPKIHLSYDVNVYYNQLTDIINNVQNTEISSVKYRNSGSLKMVGVEADVEYRNNSLRAKLNMTYQKVLKAEDYYYSDHHIYSIPAFFGSAVFSKRLYGNDTNKLWLSGKLSFASNTLNKANSRVKGSEPFTLDGYVVGDLSLKFSRKNWLMLSVDCENIFNQRYEIGGTTYFPYQMPGRTIMGTLALNL